MLELDTIKDADDMNAGNKSDLEAHESEPEISPTHLKDHIIRMDNQPFDFVPISANVVFYC